ncbi:MAG: type II secretion system protein, partial [Candidatus Gastranaerophilaceae bacterium]|nr:type II secretion system protein [Candidatus Gastranaerophilaceae bacterium]
KTVEKTARLPRSQGYLLPRNDMKRKCAFTLAEVLITLGIIGVVAALTLPTVISNYKKSEVTNKLKVVYSLLNQAYKLSTIDNGYISEWQIPSSAKEYTEKYWLPYFSGATICLTPAECGYKSNTPFYQADGTPHSTLINNDSYRLPLKLKNGIYVFFSIAKGSGTNNRSSLIIVDINGSNLPNKFGYDVFNLIVTDNVVSGAYSDYDVTTQKEHCAGVGSTCFNLIHNNNWEIPKDYPIKF